MSHPFEIRELTSDERDVAVELWHAAKLTRPWNSPEDDFDRAIDGPTSTVLGAVSEDQLVATAMVGSDGHRGWMYYVAVEASRRRSGLGRTIVAAAEEWLHERGIAKVQLMVRNDNVGVIDFYDRLGYTDDHVVVLSRWLDGGPQNPAD